MHAHRPFVPTDHVAVSEEERAGRNGKLEHIPEMVTCIDEIVGAVFDMPESTEHLNNTAVFFADNGTDNAGEARSLRSRCRGVNVAGGKYLPTDLRVNAPLLIRGPGVGQGRVVSHSVEFTDTLPAFGDVADTQYAAATDSEASGRSCRGQGKRATTNRLIHGVSSNTRH